jgi:tRNA A-37 threonylcarbamoyl transferase component Bud32
MASRCNITYGSIIKGTNVSFGKDYLGRSVIIKKITAENPLYIDTHCRFRHECLLKAVDILVPGVCDIQNMILLLEPAAYSIHDFVLYEAKNEDYHRRSNKYADDLARGLDFLHKNDLAHNLVHSRNCLVKDLDSACLSDFKMVSYIDDVKRVNDNKNMGKVFVHMFVYADVMDTTSDYIENSISKYKRLFNKDIPYRYLIEGDSYVFDHPHLMYPLEFTDTPAFREEFSVMLKKFTGDTYLDFAFSCLHNLYRFSGRHASHDTRVASHVASVASHVESVINFTLYSYGFIEPTPEILKMIFKVKGIILPNTVYNLCQNMDTLEHFGPKIFDFENYLSEYDYLASLPLTLKDIRGTRLYDMFTE